MAVYRFRINFEDNEDVVREIDILGKQSYEDFHRAIQEAISFDNLKEASFFMSDDYWRKGQEIALKVVSDEDDDDDYPRAKKNAPKLMSKCRIAEFIDDPHQRMLYVYDPAVRWTLLIELSKIVADDPKANYPKCTRSVGAAPKQYKQVLVPPPVDEEEEDDEEDKKRKEKVVFTAEEGIDETEHLGDSEEGEEDVIAVGGEEEGETAEEGGEEEASDFDPGAFGESEEEF